MEESPDINKSIADIVRNDYRTADVFKKFGINYCCGGKVSLKEACASRNIEAAVVLEELAAATRSITMPNNLDFNSWKVSFLIDYIINVHHAYLLKALPAAESSLLSFADSHQKQNPSLKEVVDIFQQLHALVIAHNVQEEETIFPYIRQIESTWLRRETYGSLFVRTLRKPLQSIEQEHTQIGSLLTALRQVTGNYTFPEKACTNHQVVFHKLEEIDRDLSQHIHLENNILFPKAIKIEQELMGS